MKNVHNFGIILEPTRDNLASSNFSTGTHHMQICSRRIQKHDGRDLVYVEKNLNLNLTPHSSLVLVLVVRARASFEETYDLVKSTNTENTVRH